MAPAGLTPVCQCLSSTEVSKTGHRTPVLQLLKITKDQLSQPAAFILRVWPWIQLTFSATAALLSSGQPALEQDAHPLF